MRNFSKAKRIVIKVGTNVLNNAGKVDTHFLAVIAQQIAELIRRNHQVILVTSGAIGMGQGALNIKHKITDVKKRQACAAVGQGILMHEYQQAFSSHNLIAAQVLLTYTSFTNRKYYVHLKNAIETLLAMGVVPVINENDCISIDEIDLAFGDNDKLSALVASKIDAELLIMLTDVDGLYDKNPRTGKSANLIPIVYEINSDIEAMAGKAGSTLGTGGMISKINAIRIASQGGCKAVLANGRTKNVILRIFDGDQLGTLFLPKRRLSNRKRWILNCPAEGRIDIDPGAEAAVKNHKSLLLVGIQKVLGDFQSGDVVDIGQFAKAVCDFSATDLRKMILQKNSNLPQQQNRKAIAHANNIVLLD
ncbi:MAG: glutamate 5-kinase [Sedimentisphaerales bacterium]|nr:glutamate 5-kinase [Sedimentisphaerales bacterium]